MEKELLSELRRKYVIPLGIGAFIVLLLLGIEFQSTLASIAFHSGIPLFTASMFFVLPKYIAEEKYELVAKIIMFLMAGLFLWSVVIFDREEKEACKVGDEEACYLLEHGSDYRQ